MLCSVRAYIHFSFARTVSAYYFSFTTTVIAYFSLLHFFFSTYTNYCWSSISIASCTMCVMHKLILMACVHAMVACTSLQAHHGYTCIWDCISWYIHPLISAITLWQPTSHAIEALSGTFKSSLGVPFAVLWCCCWHADRKPTAVMRKETYCKSLQLCW